MLRLENLVQVLVDALVLDIAENESALGDLEIRSALVRLALRLMLHMDAGVGLVGNRLKQRLKGRAVAVLGLLLNPRLAQREKIFLENALHGPNPPGAHSGLQFAGEATGSCGSKTWMTGTSPAMTKKCCGER